MAESVPARTKFRPILRSGPKDRVSKDAAATDLGFTRDRHL